MESIQTSGNILNYRENANTHSWNMMTQMKEYLEAPVIIERGEGSWLYDIDSKKYLDGNASMWTNVHGHGDPEINQAIRDQLEKLAHTTYVSRSHTRGIELAQKLSRIAPEGLDRAFLTNNGSTAIEAALKMSFQYWQLMGMAEKVGVVGMQGGYHGLSFGAMSVGDAPFYKNFKPWCFETKQFKGPECIEYNGTVHEADDQDSIADLERILKTESNQIACVILESCIQATREKGMKLQPPGFLKKVETLCRNHNVHLILDEVFVGFGRTGALFACLPEHVSPDFLCLGKGITSGYLPMGATLTTNAIYEAFLGDHCEGKTFNHGHTYGGNPLACSAALKSIEKLEALLADGSLKERIDQFGKRFVHYFENHPYISEIRQRGMVAAVDLSAGEAGNSFKPKNRAGYSVCQEAQKRGVLLRAYGDTLFFIPPLTIKTDEIDFLFHETSQAINSFINDYNKQTLCNIH